MPFGDRRAELRRWLVGTTIAVLVAGGSMAMGSPAHRYGTGRLACGLTDPQVAESSGVASASWSDTVIWTHNDSGDAPRVFAVDIATCAVRAVYHVAGAKAVDWEDMARSGTTLHIGDIGDNRARRPSITVYDVPEPVGGAPSGDIRPSATRVLTYPDGPHDAEALFVDPITGRLVVVTKAASGEAGLYLAPAQGGGAMERVAGVPVTSATGADASADRMIIRDYTSAYEWSLERGDTLASGLAGLPDPIALPITPQGEAIGYARDGSGIWTTSERRGGESPIHFVPAGDPLAGVRGTSPVASPGRTGGDGGNALPLAAAIGVPAACAVFLIGARVSGLLQRHGGGHRSDHDDGDHQDVHPEKVALGPDDPMR